MGQHERPEPRAGRGHGPGYVRRRNTADCESGAAAIASPAPRGRPEGADSCSGPTLPPVRGSDERLTDVVVEPSTAVEPSVTLRTPRGALEVAACAGFYRDGLHDRAVHEATFGDAAAQDVATLLLASDTRTHDLSAAPHPSSGGHGRRRNGRCSNRFCSAPRRSSGDDSAPDSDDVLTLIPWCLSPVVLVGALCAEELDDGLCTTTRRSTRRWCSARLPPADGG